MSRVSGQISLILSLLIPVLAGAAPGAQVDKFTYVTLSTMIADWPSGSSADPHGVVHQETNGLHGEWGFSALVMTETAGVKQSVLFDTGKFPDTVIKNVERLGLVRELCQTQKVVLSHSHSDHTGGLIALRHWIKNQAACTPQEKLTALTVAVVSDNFFRGNNDPELYDPEPFFYDQPFTGAPTKPTDIKFPNEMTFVYDFLRKKFEGEEDGRFIRIKGPYEVIPGVWATGPVRPQMSPLKEYLADEGQRLVVDDQALVIQTAEGAVVLSGCGHSGLRNVLNFVTQYMFTLSPQVVAVLGGWHLFPHASGTLAEYGHFLANLGVKYFIGSHCTGLETIHNLRSAAPLLTEKTAINDTVGTQFGYDRTRSTDRFQILGAFLNIPREQ